MRNLFRRWKSIALVTAAVLAGTASLVVSDGTKADANNTIFVYAGSGQAGIAVELFLPGSVAVAVGDTLEFINPYEEPHTVTYEVDGDPVPSEFAPYNLDSTASFDGSESFNTGLFEKDQHLEVTFEKVGAYKFLCLLHPGMEIDIAVVPEGTSLPPQGANSPANMQTIEEGIALGEAASAKALAEVNAVNASATDSWLVETGPSVPFKGASVDVMRFLPVEINIGVGDEVVWRNEYGVPHTVTFFAGPPPEGFDPFVSDIPSNVFQEGVFYNAMISVAPVFGGETEFSLTFPKAGSYSYVCVLHADQGMAGVVNVGGATGDGGIRPPDTGDAGLSDRSTGSWMMLAGVALLLVSSAGAALVVRRN